MIQTLCIQDAYFLHKHHANPKILLNAFIAYITLKVITQFRFIINQLLYIISLMALCKIYNK